MVYRFKIYKNFNRIERYTSGFDQFGVVNYNMLKCVRIRGHFTFLGSKKIQAVNIYHF